MAKGVSKLKKVKAAAGAGSAGGHAKLNQKFVLIGARLAGAKDMKGVAVKASGSKAQTYFTKALGAMTVNRAQAVKQFPRQYRALIPNHDELVSTASVRSLLEGIVSKTPNAMQKQSLAQALGEVSDIRLPTKMVGYALASGRMQHPTNAKDAVFEDPNQTAWAHAAFDIGRRAFVAEAVDSEFKKSGSGKLALNAGTRAAISFTLHEGAAPPSAADVAPFLWKKPSAATVTAALRAREDLKSVFVSLGGVQDKAAGYQSANRMRGRRWQAKGRSRSSVSPARL